MWQLKSDGDFTEVSGFSDKGLISVDPTEASPLDGLDPLQLASAVQIKISFANHADGRGFSIAKQIAEQFRHSNRPPKLVATGKLIPDQARLAFQSGFDVIEIADEDVRRHSEASWRESLADAVQEIYFQTCDGYREEPRDDLGKSTNAWGLRHVS